MLNVREFIKAHLPSHRPRPNIKTNTYYGLLPGLELCPTESGTNFYIAWWEEEGSEKYQRVGVGCWCASWENVLGRRRRRFRTKWPWRRKSEQFADAVSLSFAPPIHWRWCLLSRKLSTNKAHGFFLTTRRRWDALTKHVGSRNYKNRMERT